MEILKIIGGVAAISGSLFLLLASIGLLRMPDVYNRMQAGTKATTFGTVMFLMGVTLANPTWFPKIFILIIFILLTNPISSHILARAAHFVGVPLAKRSVTDQLAEHRKMGGVK
jgi:multicomponent Na+:H+ antiporter subunit G